MARGTILIIDDDNFLRKVYQSELRDKGYNVLLAADGAEGVKKAQDLQPDLIILDLIMPRKSGFDVLADALEDDELYKIPIIVLSNLAQSSDQERAFNLGAVEYLVKDNTTLDIIADKIALYMSPTFKEEFARRPRKKVPAAKAAREAPIAAIEPPVAGDEKRAEARMPVPKSSKAHNFCSQCGSRVKANDKFCTECGAPQQETS